jgi:copper oxidase (laccase) domain-containing protein
VLLAVSVADCVPVYLTAPAAGAIALLHAGWRGTAAGILEAGIEVLERHAAVSRSDIVMHCGVSICGSCYEVGPEVILNVTGRSVDNPERLDLRAELARRAERAGVTEVTISPHCAAHDGGRFHSHRASGGRAGRMIAYLGRPLSGA